MNRKNADPSVAAVPRVVRPGLHTSIRPIARAVAFALLAVAAPAWAGPTGEQVVAGQANVSRSGTNTLITQGTDRAAINWLTFDIGVTESVRFAQPSVSSIALNRVLGQNPTEIFGSLSANGQVFILNPNGVLFGRGAQVDVGGLVASTLSLSNEDFMAGRYRFATSPLAAGAGVGEVVNQGDIVANGGYVAFIGSRVRNEGTITAANGSVALAAGDQVTVNLNGNKLIGLSVDQGVLNALADNKGLIKADGGQVLLTAKAADQLIKSVVNNDGIIEATTLSNVNGVIRLEADNIASGGTLRADGGAGLNGGSITLAATNDITLGASSIISASGARGGDVTAQAQAGTLLADGRIEAAGSDATGGTVKLLGNQVGLINAASVDASGKTGGGTVLVGGDFQGKNPDVQNAFRTYVGPNATIKADAVTSGNGGKVIVWADDVTRYYGGISVKGGEQSGNGGFVEVSGKGSLDFNGLVNTTALNGNIGTLLLDPDNIEVITGGAATLVQVDQFADPNLGACTNLGANCSMIAPATINVAAANVVLQANNSILFTNAIGITTAGVGLTATATTGSITVNAGITTANRASAAGAATSGGITLSAGGAVNINAALTTGTAASTNSTATTGSISITAASITSNASGSMTTGIATGGNGNNTATSGAITLNANTGAVSLGAALSTGNATTVTNNGGSTSSGNITIANAGAVNLNAALTTGSAITGNGGTDDATSGTISVTGTSITSNASGSIGTGLATSGGGGTDDAVSGNITLNAGAGAVTLASGLTTGAANSSTNTAGSARSGTISVTNTSSITAASTSAFTTGTASGDGNSVNEIATSGSIVLASTGAIQLAAVDALKTGNASMSRNNNATNVATVGNITISSAAKLFNGTGTNGAVDVSFGTASGIAGTTLAPGVLAVTTTGGAGDAGGIFVTSAEALRLGVIATGAGAQNVSIGTTGAAAALTVPTAAEVLSGDAVTLSTATSTLTISDTAFDVGAGSLTLQTDGTLTTSGGAGSIRGAGGTVTIQPASAGTTVGIAGAAGTLQVTATNIAALQDGFSQINIGRTDGTGLVTVGASTFTDPITIRAGGATGSITVSGNVSSTNNAATLTAGNGVTVNTGVTVNSGTGTLLVNADSDGAGTGTLTLAGTGTLTSANTTANAVTLRAQDVALSGTSVVSATGGTAAGINVFSTQPTQTMDIGGAGGATGINLSDAELARFTNFVTLTLGETGVQSGAITVTTATSPVAAGNIVVNSNSGAGGIVLADAAAATALATTTGALTLRAGTGGITAASATNAFAELSTTGTITLTSDGVVGSNTNRIQFPAAQDDVNVTTSGAGDNIFLNGLGALTLGTIAAAANLDVTSAGAIAQSAASTVAGTSSFSAGGNAITLTNAGNDFTGAVSLSNTGANAIQITDTNALQLGTVSTANTLTVNAGGSVTQSGVVTAGALVATLTGAASQLDLGTQSNNVTNVGAITAPAGFTLTNGNNPTTITGAVNTTNAPVSISTGTGGYTQNDVDITAGGGAITITADAVAIAANTGSNAFQTTGVLTLKPSSAATAMSLAGASTFDLTAAEITSLAGGVTGAGSIVIGDAAASTGVMTIGGAVNFGAKTVTLDAGSFTDGNTTGQTITANTLNLNARTGTIGTAAANGAIDVAVTNLTANTVNQNAFINATGAVNFGAGASSVGSGNLTVTATGAITDSGAINAALLTISSAGGTTLDFGHTVTNFNATNTGAGDIALTNTAATLGITGITQNTGNVTVNNTGAISTSGAITTAANGNISLTASTSETIGAAVAAGGSGTVSLTATAGALAVNGAVSSTSGAITATAGTAITETGSLATSGLLTTSSTTGATLNGANAVGSFNATNSASGNIALTNTANPLTITGISNSGGGSDTISNTGAIGITGTIAAAGGGAVNLTALGASGSITESGAGLVNTTGTLTTSSVTGETLNGANTVGTFNATNTTSGNIVLSDAGGVDITGISNAVGNVTLTNSGAVTQSGAMSAIGLELLGAGTYSLTNTGNNVATLAANTGAISYTDSNALSIGTVNSTAGITATGLVDVRTQSGDLTLNNAVATASTSANAVTLIADVAATPNATGTGGNFINNAGAAAITTGGGGAWRIYTGNPGGTNRGGLVEASKRYNVDDGSDPIAAGNRIYFRIQPTLTLTADDKTITYSGAPTFTYTPSGLIDGDLIGAAISSGPSFAVSGSVSTSGNFTAGTLHNITPSAATTSLGYTLSYANGSLTVTPLALAGTAIAAGSSVYASALTPGAVTFGTIASGDLVTATATVNTTNGTSTGGHPNVGTFTQTADTAALGGADAGNYTLAPFTSAANYTISPLGLTATAIAAGSSVYASALTPGAVTFGTIASGDLVTATATVNTTNGTSTGGHPNVGTFTQTADTAALGGADAGNYTLAPFTSAANYTISPLGLTATAIAAGSSVYASALTPGAVTFGTIASGDLVTATATVNTTNGTSTGGHPNVGTFTQTADTAALGGADAGNYTLAPFTSAANYTISPLGLTATAIAAGSSVYASALTPGAVTFGTIASGDLVTATATVNTTNGTSTGGHPNVGTFTQTADTAALGGADAGNYTLAPFTSAANYTISPLGLTATAIAAGSSVYASALTPGAVTFGTIASGDLVTATATVNTTNGTSTGGHPNVGTFTQTADTAALGGADAGNYTLAPFTSAANYTISPLGLTATAIAAGSSVYASALTPGAVTFGTIASGDLVTATATVNTTNGTSTGGHPNVGTFTQTADTAALGGADAGNYTLAPFTSAANYTISPLGLTATAIAAGSSVYASALTPGAVTFGTIASGDLVTATATVNTTNGTSTGGHPNVGTFTQTADTAALGGADAGNYTLAPFTSAANYTISPLGLTATAIAAGSSVYASALTPGAVTFGTIASGDLVTATATVNTTNGTSTGGHPNVGTFTQTADTAALGGADAGNYTLAPFTSAANYTISPLGLTATAIAAGSSVYASALTPGAVTFGTIASGDLVTATATVNTTNGTSTGGHPNVGTFTQTADTAALGGADAGNYTLAPFTSAANYTISPLGLTATAIAAGSSVYASALTPGAVTFGTIASGDLVTATATVNTTNGTSTGGHPNVGTFTQTADTAALGGADAGNYTLAPFTSAANYTISPLGLTATAIAAGSSVYASALTPGAVTFGTIASGDLVTATATVNTTNGTSTGGHPNVGTFTQTADTAALGGADAGNYTLAPFTSAANYTISPLGLTGTITTATTTYGQALTPGTANLTNVILGDIVTPVSTTVDTTGLLSGSNNLVAGVHLGIQKVSALGGADGGNYSFANVLGDYTVNQLPLTGTAIAAGSSVYASALTAGAVTFGNVIGGDILTNTASVNTLTLSTGGHPVVGSYTQTTGALVGADSANYTLAPFTSAPNYTITPLALTGAAIAAGSSVYASALTPGAVSFGTIASGDLVTSTASVNTGAVSSSGNFIAGTYTQSTGALGGADVGNYSFGGFTSAANYTITRLALAGAAIAAGSSVYASALAPGAVSFGNVVAGDIVTNVASVNTGAVSSSGNFVAGTYTQRTGALGGADAGNYTLAPFTSAANYTISRLALTGTAIAAGSSVYASALAPGAVSFTNVVGTDIVADTATVNAGAVSTSGNFVAGTYTQTTGALGGADAGNYALAPFTSAANYTISQRALTVSATGVNKIYDATTAATVTLSDNRIAGDSFADSYASAAFADPNVGVGKPVSVSGINIAGADAGNYTFNTTAVTSASIAPQVSVNALATSTLDSVLASLYSSGQLPPPTVSGPTGGWRQLPGMPSSLPGVQPYSLAAGGGPAAVAQSGEGTSSATPGVLATAGVEGQVQGQLSNQGAEPIPSGAVRDLVTIINGGVRMSPRQGGWLRKVSRR